MASYTMPMPGPPTITYAAATSGKVVVTFDPPAYVGLGVASYVAMTSVGSNVVTCPSSVYPLQIALPASPNAACRVLVCGSNVAGCGPYADASVAVTPYGLPDAPIINAVTVANGSCTLQCVGTSSMAAPILQYSVVSTPIGMSNASSSSTIVASTAALAMGTPYLVQVGASNVAGVSPLSKAVTLLSVPCYAPLTYVFSAGNGGALGAINGGDTGGGGAGGVTVVGGSAVAMTAGTANPGVNGGGAGYGGSGYGAGGGGGGLWAGVGYDGGGTGCKGCVYMCGPSVEYFSSVSGSYTAPATGTYNMLLVGGGGGGGCKQTAVGHGGGGGGYIVPVTVTVAIGSVFVITIGNGGISNTDGGATTVVVAGTTYTANGGQNGGVSNNGGSGSSGGGGAYQCTIGRTAGLSAGNANVLTTGMGTLAFSAALASVARGQMFQYWKVTR